MGVRAAHAKCRSANRFCTVEGLIRTRVEGLTRARVEGLIKRAPFDQSVVKRVDWSKGWLVLVGDQRAGW